MPLDGMGCGYSSTYLSKDANNCADLDYHGHANKPAFMPIMIAYASTISIDATVFAIVRGTVLPVSNMLNLLLWGPLILRPMKSSFFVVVLTY